MAKNYSEMWEQVLAAIREHVSDTQYKSFFQSIQFLSFDAETQKLVLQVNSVNHAKYLEGPFKPLLKATIVPVFGAVNLAYRPVTAPATSQVEVAQEEEPQTDPIATNLYTEYTFSTFVEGEANKLARSIGMSIAEHPRSTKFNPMFVYGPSGCGKTHLINAIGLDIIARYPKKKVLYVGAREFRDQYIKAQIVDNNVPEFIAFYQQFDVLIVDDVQEWESSPKAAETFFHIFNHLFMNGKRIILASDRPPVEMEGMEERLLTRFKMGLIAEMEKPNEQLCIDILNSKIHRDGLTISADVVRYIAQTANGSVRDLEGVITSLMAYSVVYNSNVDMHLAERVITRAVKVDNHPLQLDEIIECVCNRLGVEQKDVMGKSRKKEIALARHISMYFAQKYTRLSGARIGKLIGGRDHSTVIHSCGVVEQRLRIDEAFRNLCDEIAKDFKLK